MLPSPDELHGFRKTFTTVGQTDSYQEMPMELDSDDDIQITSVIEPKLKRPNWNVPTQRYQGSGYKPRPPPVGAPNKVLVSVDLSEIPLPPGSPDSLDVIPPTQQSQPCNSKSVSSDVLL